MKVVAIVFGLLLVLSVAESCLHQRALRRIPLRILVNGTRGKTTVTRNIASILRQAGIRTYAKTTGSEARRILPDGTEESYRRENRPVNLMEQLPFVRLAAAGGVQAIVVECMAQRIENQFLMGDKLIRPHYVVMTNAYVDHIEEIGATQEETIHVLAQSIPSHCKVIALDARFQAYTDHLILAQEPVDVSAFSACSYPIYEENVRLTYALARELNIPQETAESGVLCTAPDIGMIKEVDARGWHIRNGFAANDAVSFGAILEECAQQGEYVLLYNHRRDRDYRVDAFVDVLRRSGAKPTRIGVIGEKKAWCARYMQRRTGIEAQAVEEPLRWLAEQSAAQVLCAGNIKGEGRAFLEKMIEEAHSHV